jgi:basic membrane protein A
MKKVLALALAAVMAFSMVACGSGSKAEGLKIAVISSPSGVDDGNFNQNIYNGILKFVNENEGATVTPIREESGDTAAAIQAVADVVADYDVLVCNGFQFSGIGNLAQENPDAKFILIDAWPAVDGVELTADKPLSNVYACYYAEQESGFATGMAAALSTKTGKVAMVNGIAFPSNVNYQYGFECGVKYANAIAGLNVQVVELPSYAGTDVTGANVGGNYVGDFSDPATGKVVANALIKAGCDVIMAAAGASGNGVFTAAKEAKGVYVLGGDVDQFDDGVNGDTNVVLTSALKKMDSTVYKVLNTVKDGTFKGTNVTLDAKTDSTGYVNAEGRQQLTADVIAKIDAAMALVKEGKIVPAANFNGITPETFTW